MDVKDIDKYIESCRKAGYSDEEIANDLDRYARDLLSEVLNGVRREDLAPITDGATKLRKRAEQLRENI